MFLNNTRNMSSRFMMVLLAVTVSVFLFAGCNSEEAVTKDLVATFSNGTTPELTKADYDVFLNVSKFTDPSFVEYEKQPDFTENMIKQYVGLDVIFKNHKTADDKLKQMVDQRMSDMKTQVVQNAGGAVDAWTKGLEQGKVSEEQLYNFMLKQANLAEYMNSLISDAEVKKSYDDAIKENKNSFAYVSVRHILVSTKNPETGNELRSDADALKLAKEVVGKLNDGGDFAKLAKEYSDDPGSATQGGLYSKVNPNQFVPEFKDACLNLELNKVSEPVKTEYGYHVMKVEERGERSFADVTPLIKQQLAYDKITNVMAEQIEQAKIQFKIPIASASVAPAASAETK